MRFIAEHAVTEYRVTARNIAIASENKIHDDTVAKRFGFAGGLVPGVEVYAYMTHLPVERWGRSWLEHGSAECRFLEPLYDCELATVTAKPAGRDLELALESRGRLCAVGGATLDDANSAGIPEFEQIQEVVPPAARPKADEQTLAPGTRLGIAPFRLTREFLTKYLDDIGEPHAIYRDEGICHPGILLRLCNWALMHNVELGPWIHTGSKVRHFGIARVGEELRVRASIAANYERKGHGMVDLDALILTEARKLIARVEHRAIWRPRQISKAG